MTISHRSLPFAALCALVISGCGKGSSPDAAPDAAVDKAPVAVELAKIARMPIRTLVTISGSFVAGQGTTAKLAPTAPGRVLKVLVREGDHVKAGQLLATIDTRVQQAQNQSAIAAVAAAQASSAQSALTAQVAASDQAGATATAELGVSAAEVDREAQLAQAQATLSSAQVDLQKLRAGARPQELAQTRQSVVQAQIARTKAQSDLTRDQALAKEGFASKRQLEDSQAALSTAQSSLISAQQSESLLKAGARSEDLQSASLKVQAAQSALTAIKAAADKRVLLAQATAKQTRAAALNVKAKQQEARASTAALAQRQADQQAAGASVSLGELRAPISGAVTRRYLNPGDLADTTVPIVEIASNSSIDFLGSIPPGAANGIAAGMNAIISIPGGESVKGTVSSVSPADPVTGLSSVRVVSPAHATPGTFTTCNIVRSVDQKAIAVPREAVVDHDGKAAVFIDQDGVAKQTDVIAGATDGDFTAISGKLSSGQQVVKLGQFELADGDKITEAKPAEKAADAGSKD